jgi:Flp pilus assembly protein TadG
MDSSRIRVTGRAKSQRGQALLMSTLTLVPTLGLVGFVVDTGWAQYQKEACTSAAISGAVAGARAAQNASNFTCSSGVTCQSPTACPSTLNTPSNPIQAACLYVKQNGFTNGTANATVLVDANTTAPPNVSGVSPSYWIRVTVTQKLPLTFLSVFGQQFVSVSAQSIGAVFGSASSGCIYVMGSTGADINMSGGGISTNCGLLVNSTSSGAITSAGGSITASGSATVSIHGAGTWVHAGGTITPNPSNGAPAVNDPFASMVAPGTSGLTDQPSVNMSSGSQTIQPGIYTSAINLAGGNLTLASGLYYLEGGINMSAGTITSAAGGVTLYIESGSVNMSGGSITLSAPTTGTWEGILIFQSRTNASSLDLSGGTQTYSGAIYALDATYNMAGGTFNNVTFVVNNMNIAGGSVGTIDGGAVTQYTAPTVGRIE